MIDNEQKHRDALAKLVRARRRARRKHARQLVKHPVLRRCDALHVLPRTASHLDLCEEREVEIQNPVPETNLARTSQPTAPELLWMCRSTANLPCQLPCLPFTPATLPFPAARPAASLRATHSPVRVPRPQSGTQLHKSAPPTLQMHNTHKLPPETGPVHALRRADTAPAV